jgi:hypothetical protein
VTSLYDRVFASDPFKQVLADYPDYPHDNSQLRKAFKAIICALDSALLHSPWVCDWNAPPERPQHVSSLVIFDGEDHAVTEIPVMLSRSIAQIGDRKIFVAHERGVLSIAREIIRQVLSVMNGEALAKTAVRIR